LFTETSNKQRDLKARLAKLTLSTAAWSALFVCNATSVTVAQDNAKVDTAIAWPSFLGAKAVGVDATKIPVDWNTKENIAWKTPLTGHGQSSPVVWGNSVYVTTVDGPNKDTYHVISLDRNTGKVQWDYQVANTAPVANSYYVSRAAPTPVVDAERIVAFFESGDCVSLSHDGKQQWSKSVEKEFGPWKAEFGLGASPCQDAQRVFLLLEHDGPGHLVALSKSTGQTLWSQPRAAGRSWASPATFEIGGETQVIVSSNGTLKGYSAQEGTELWSIGNLGGNTSVSPIDIGKGTFLVGASAGRNGENATQSQKSNGLVQVSKSGSGWEAKFVWQADKLSPSWASPIQFGQHAYWVSRVGVVSCVDVATGNVLYNERLKQACWATPVGIGDKVYFFGKEGLTTVLSAGPSFQVLAENQTLDLNDLPKETTQMAEETTEERRRSAAAFSGPTVYGAALAGDTLIMRIGNQVIAIEQPTEQAK